MTHDLRQDLRGYGIAIACVIAACLAWLVTTALIGNRISSSYFLVAVIAAGRFGGYRPSWLALVLGLIPVAYHQYLLPDRFGPAAWTIVSVYFLLGFTLVLLMESERNARRRAEVHAQEASEKQGLLEQKIAERQVVEQELREQRQQTELALQAGGLGIWIWDVATNRVQWSKTNEAIHGYAPGTFTGTFEDSISRIHPDDRKAIQQGVAKLFTDEPSGYRAYRVVWPDESVHWIEGLGTVFRDDQGKPVRILGVCSDITDRWEAEVALRAREAELKQRQDELLLALDAARMGTWTLNLGAHSVECSKTTEEILGFAPGKFPGDFSAFLAVVHPDDREATQSALAARLERQEDSPNPFQFRIVWPDGRVRWLESKGKTYFDSAGKPLRVIGVCMDITERKANFDNLQAQQNLLRSLIDVQEQEKQFICYEFHDGLMQYAAGAKMMMEAYAQNLSAREDPTPIDAAINSLRQGIEDGRRVIRGIHPTVLDDMGVKAAIDDLIDQFSASGIAVESEFDPRIGRLPKELEATIYRVVQEALTNAKKYSGTDHVRIEMKAVNGDVYLDVRDFGCGFDVESARKRGFGLLGMTERVRLQGGECSIHSEPAAGTCISARFPIRMAAANEHSS